MKITITKLLIAVPFLYVSQKVNTSLSISKPLYATANYDSTIMPGKKDTTEQNRSKQGWFTRVIFFIFLFLLAFMVNASDRLELDKDIDSSQYFSSSYFRVKATSSQKIGSGYLQVEAIMRGKLWRNNGSTGTYKVPITLIYPENHQQCNGVGIEDVVNSVFYETFETTGTSGDPLFPTLFPFGRLILGDDFIKDSGYVYGLAQWNKLVIKRQRDAGTLSNPSFHIERARDAFSIIRDLSAFFRRPSRFLVGHSVPTPCAVDDVIGFGYSQTGMLLRQLYFEEQNTQLVNSNVFDEGLVFEGSIQAVPGGHCRSVTTEFPYFSYSFENCEGATPASQGRVMTINAETDVQFAGGWKARAQEQKSYYKVYEIAGASHIPTPLFDLKQLGIRPVEQATQNYADIGPVYRAMTNNLRNWIRGIDEPPQSAILQGSIELLDSPLFSSNSWGSDQEQVFVFSLGDDGNTLGGLRLPHLRTTISDESQVGGSLGIYRGTACDNDPSSSEFILNCQLSGDPNIYNMSAGTFHPYTNKTPDLCNSFYPSSKSYIDAVRNGAMFAVAKGWILPEEIESLVAIAAMKAEEFPGCVP